MTAATMEANKNKAWISGSAFENIIGWFGYASYGYLVTNIAAVFVAPGDE